MSEGVSKNPNLENNLSHEPSREQPLAPLDEQISPHQIAGLIWKWRYQNPLPGHENEIDDFLKVYGSAPEIIPYIDRFDKNAERKTL